MYHTISADDLSITTRDVIVCEFMVRQLCLTIAHHQPTRRELARIIQHKITSQSHFFNDVELRLMQAIADALTAD